MVMRSRVAANSASGGASEPEMRMTGSPGCRACACLIRTRPSGPGGISRSVIKSSQGPLPCSNVNASSVPLASAASHPACVRQSWRKRRMTGTSSTTRARRRGGSSSRRSVTRSAGSYPAACGTQSVTVVEDAGAKTDDTYAAQRTQIRAAGAQVIDRFMSGGHIGHNKFQVLDHGGPQAVLLGSTNWTSNALCAQTNNAVIARSPPVAAAYREYWDRMKADTVPPGAGGKAKQGTEFRAANGRGVKTIPLEDGSGTVELWFSPNTAKPRKSPHGDDEPVPPDLQRVFD